MRNALTVACLLMAFFCCAQRTSIKNDFLFNHLTVKDGLSINETTCVFQDSRGFVWIGTTDGLNLYSGNHITVYRHNPKDPLSLPDNSVHNIAEDKNQNLWITTNGGLTRMNLNSCKVEKVYGRTGDPKDIYSSVVLLIDTQERIWTADNGLDLYDPSCDCFHHFVNQCHMNEREFRTSNMIVSLYQDSRGRIWVGTNNGIYQFDLTNGKFSKPLYLLDPTREVEPIVTDIIEDHAHQLWLGTWGSGLVKFFPDENSISASRIRNPINQAPSFYNVVDKITESKTSDGKYHLWVGCDSGFGEWDDSSGNFFIHQLMPGDYKSIRKIYTDHSGIVWIATESGGIYILDPYRQVFKTNFFNPKVYAPATQFGEVNYIFSEADTTWVTTWYGNALYKLDKNFNLIKSWEHIPAKTPNDESNRGNHFFRDKRGFAWVSTLNGLHRLDTKTNQFKSFYHNLNDTTSLVSDRVVRYFEDSKGVSWVCFYKKGLCKFDPATGKIYDYVGGQKSKNGQIYYFNIWDMLEDDSGDVWFADDGLGLWKYDRKLKMMKHMFANEFPEGHIASLYKDQNKNIWAATRSGVIRFRGDSVHLLTTSDGLPSNNVYGIKADKQKYFWFLTNQGLARYDGENRVRVFKQEDGLQKIYDEQVAFHALSDGRMAIGSAHYITVFDPAKMSLNEKEPSVHITQFKIFGEPVDWNNSVSGKSIVLTHDQNQFSFDFAVLNYSNPSGNKFYHQMVGFDPDWISSPQGFINYTNLDAGDYVFRVKGANADGVMSKIDDYILIHIVPPVWRTWWFISLCVVALGGIPYSLYRIRLNQLLRLEKLRLKISTDLHDDMGSTLSSISILSNMALKSDNPSKQVMLSEINDSSITLMERMDDIVWSINPRNDSLDSLMLRVRNFASKLFEAKGIDYLIELPPAISSIRFSMESRQHIYLIMKEAVNNVVKYSECTRAIIKVSLTPLTVEISDNGKGFDTSVSFLGNGIHSMKSRAQLLDADLIIQSSQGQGTSVQLRVKIK